MKKYEMAAEIRKIVGDSLPGIEKLNVMETENMMLAIRKMSDTDTAEPTSDDDADLDARMKAAGMIPLSELLANNGMSLFMVHTGVRDIPSFLEFAEKKHASYMRMRMEYELGETPKDELYEWVFAHSGVWGDVVVNLRAAIERSGAATANDKPGAI